MPISQVQLDELNRVNAEVNAIPYNAVVGAHEPYDWWTDVPVPGQSWECRDYTLAKADRLVADGWPKEALSVILCYTELNEYHAVLGVLVDGETWILDNRVTEVYQMSSPPYAYQWERRQVAGTTDFEPVA